MMEKLTAAQQRFCEEYVVDWNATRAAIEAGYSKKTARQQGSRLLTNVDIQAYIEEVQKDLQRLAGVSALRNMKTLASIAYDEELDLHSRLNALDKLNKMLPGAYAPTRTDLTTGGDKIQAAPITFSGPAKDIDLDCDE